MIWLRVQILSLFIYSLCDFLCKPEARDQTGDRCGFNQAIDRCEASYVLGIAKLLDENHGTSCITDGPAITWLAVMTGVTMSLKHNYSA